jgi:hypothetical protein
MIKKIFSIIICILFVQVIFSTGSIAFFYDNNYYIVDNRLIEISTVFNENNLIYETFEQENKGNNKFIQNKNDLIIDIIQQLNESVILDFLQTLVSFGPRVTGSSSCTQAGEWIFSEFQDMGLDVRYHNWSHGGESGQNVEATLHGVNETSDEIYIICAHYDTVSGSPGADDDGSGVAAVMSAAEILSHYIVNHTIRFITFSGEEQGLYGSYQYAKQASNNGDNIIGVLNSDMIGYANNQSQGNNIKIYYNSESNWIVDYIDNIANKYLEYVSLQVIRGGYSWGSDHSSFWQFGYDAVQYKEYEVNPYYHTPNDIIDNLNLTYLTKCSKLLLASIAEFIQISLSNSPPNNPIITGPANGKPNNEYFFTFGSTDPDDDNILEYIINWGDNSIYEHYMGPFMSGEEIIANHTWTLHGTYTIKVKAVDIFGAESDWGRLTIDMKKGKHINNNYFELIVKFFEIH